MKMLLFVTSRVAPSRSVSGGLPAHVHSVAPPGSVALTSPRTTHQDSLVHGSLDRIPTQAAHLLW